MIDRNKFDKSIDIIQNIEEKYRINNENSYLVEDLAKLKQDFENKVLFVGKFNVGKSALLNGLLGLQDFLEEKQEPMTALATELRYSEKLWGHVYTNSGNQETITPNKKYSIKEYQKIEYGIPSEALSELGDFVLVDTPGIDSGIEAHTKALNSYLYCGTAFVLVIDQGEGGIDNINLDLLDELSEYSDQIVILINKCDQIPTDLAVQISQAVRDTLEAYGMDYPVYTVSARDNDIKEKLLEIFSHFRAQDTFDVTMKAGMRAELETAFHMLRTMRQRMHLDTYELDRNINSFQEDTGKIKRYFQHQRSLIVNDSRNQAENIISDIRSALQRKSHDVADAILMGSIEGAQAIVIETVRPVLIESVKEFNTSQLSKIAEGTNFCINNCDDDQKPVADLVVSLASNIKALIDNGVFNISKNPAASSKDNIKSVYRGIIGISAIATDIIAPWMEIVLLLAPDIIELFQNILGESAEDKVSHQFKTFVIPKICNNLYPYIEEAVSANEDLLLAQFEAFSQQKLETVGQKLTELNAARENKIKDYQNWSTALSGDLKMVGDMLKEVE